VGPCTSVPSLLLSIDGRWKSPAELEGRVGGDGGACPPKGKVWMLAGGIIEDGSCGRDAGVWLSERPVRCSALPLGSENFE
jgi:hypothetical protein